MYSRLYSPPRDRSDRSDVSQLSASEFVRRHRQECASAVAEGQAAIRRSADDLLSRIVDFRNFRYAWRVLQKSRGWAPGPDGMTYSDYSRSDQFALFSDLAREIHAGGYLPGPERIVQIPKTSGKGDRTLRLQNIRDRVVQRAILQILQPLLDPTFLDCSLGFRPGRGVLDALAIAEAVAVADDRWYWISDDIKDAFDEVPLQRLYQILEATLRSESLVSLIQCVVQGTGSAERSHGIPQGGPLSPLLLNFYLNHFFDRPWQREHPTLPFVRYADDLLALCRSPEEAENAYQNLSGMVQRAGFSLKGNRDDSIQRVDGESSASWLGMKIYWADGRLSCHLAKSRWKQLADRLDQANDKANSPIVANDIVNGFIAQTGPTFTNDADLQRKFCRRLRKIGSDAGFDELPSPPEIIERWQAAAETWDLVRERFSR